MPKIVSIFSRNEITSLPFSEKDALNAAKALFNADIEPATFSLILAFISNNSGVESFASALNSDKKTKKVGK